MKLSESNDRLWADNGSWMLGVTTSPTSKSIYVSYPDKDNMISLGTGKWLNLTFEHTETVSACSMIGRTLIAAATTIRQLENELQQVKDDISELCDKYNYHQDC